MVKNGLVTTFVILPTGGLVSGQAAIVDLVEGTTSDMIMKSPVAMVAEIGDAASAGTGSRGELIVKFRELLEDTKFFMTHRAEFDRAQLFVRQVELFATDATLRLLRYLTPENNAALRAKIDRSPWAGKAASFSNS